MRIGKEIVYRRGTLDDVQVLVDLRVRFLNELIREARSMGLRYLHLHASKDGEPIYRKAGFVEPKMPELKLILE